MEGTWKQYTYFQNTKELVIARKSEQKHVCSRSTALPIQRLRFFGYLFYSGERGVWRSRLWRSRNSLAAGFNDIRSYHLSVDSIPFYTFMLVLVNYTLHIWAVLPIWYMLFGTKTA
jgi:hypothetical protein